MTKAQSFFGGTNPKPTGEKARQPGTFSATPGVNSTTNNAQHSGQAHHKVASLHTKKVTRPSLPGKVDNRDK